MAIWSLVLGILSLTVLPVLAAIPAIICGNKAHSRIDGSAGALTGKGLANAGLVTGYLSIVLALIGMIAGMVVPHFLHGRQVAREQDQQSICMSNLKEIEDATQRWALETKQGANAHPRAEDLAPYMKDRRMPTCPAGGAYTIDSVGSLPSCSKHGAFHPPAGL